jgi:hypothetical protein
LNFESKGFKADVIDSKLVFSGLNLSVLVKYLSYVSLVS